MKRINALKLVGTLFGADLYVEGDKKTAEKFTALLNRKKDDFLAELPKEWMNDRNVLIDELIEEVEDTPTTIISQSIINFLKSKKK